MAETETKELTIRGRLCKYSYDNGYFTKDMLAGWVKLGSLQAYEYKIITGDDYVETQA